MVDLEDMYNHFDDLKLNNVDNIFGTINKLPEKELMQVFQGVFILVHVLKVF